MAAPPSEHPFIVDDDLKSAPQQKRCAVVLKHQSTPLAERALIAIVRKLSAWNRGRAAKRPLPVAYAAGPRRGACRRHAVRVRARGVEPVLHAAPVIAENRSQKYGRMRLQSRLAGISRYAGRAGQVPDARPRSDAQSWPAAGKPAGRFG